MNADPYNLRLTQPQRARLERARDDGEMNGVGDWRFRVGDVLLFRKYFFNAQPGGLNGLEHRNMRRDRTGLIRSRTRERPQGANRGQYLYTVLFSDPATTVPRLPLDNDDDAAFIAET